MSSGRPSSVASKLWPLVSHSKANLQSIVERIDEILAIKTDLENMIDMLTQIDNLSQNNGLVGTNPQMTTSSAPDLSVILALKDRVVALEMQLKPLVAQASQQSAELDEFLNSYEAAVRTNITL